MPATEQGSDNRLIADHFRVGVRAVQYWRAESGFPGGHPVDLTAIRKWLTKHYARGRRRRLAALQKGRWL